jgi:multiple antibiotic resistance protein
MVQFLEVFIPLFVAVDPFGMVPVFMGVTGQMSEAQRRRVSLEAVMAAAAITLGFMLLGEAIFRFLGIDQHDFKIAGGIILLVLAVIDLLIQGKPSVHESEMLGLVPLATPLIAGPATLTTTLVLVTTHGFAWTTAGLAINFALLLVALLSAGWIARWVGENTLRALSKLIMILLAAIAVNFIRTGIGGVVESYRG